MSKLFSPLELRRVRFKNRIFVSPMCQYTSVDGVPTDWHFVHLGSRAVGGAGLVMMEATAVCPEGRITPWDSGIWADEQGRAFERTIAFMQGFDCVAGIQLAHAGRKASTDAPWRGGRPLAADAGGWQPLAPSPIAFAEEHPTPHAMSAADIDAVTDAFAASAARSHAAGFGVLEIHMAHGYLLHEFLSPLSNRRTDEYGGTFENRVRLALRVTRAVRDTWPERLPLFARISCTDWVDGGWDLEQSIALCRMLKELGVDLIDCSSGGLVPFAKVPAGPGFQVPFAAAIRSAVGIPTGAVGLITHPMQAEQIVRTQQADAVFLARELLRDPYWPLRAAATLHADIRWPEPYERARTI